MREIVINKNDANQRIDKFMQKLMPNMPQSMIYKSLRKDCVKVNGKHIKDGAFRIREGDILRLYVKEDFFEQAPKKIDFMSITPELSIIYEDENILLADKKQGICVHTDESGGDDSLIDHIKSYLWRRGEYNPDEENSFVPALCNRIDRNTGGIVIAAKNAESLRILNEKIRSRQIEKKYLCLVYGHPSPKSGTIRGYIFKDESKKQVYFYDSPKKGAKTAVTLYRVLKEFPQYSLVEAELKTGRTHQIRVSMARIGHPILGDGKYGTNDINTRFDYYGQALYSYKLKFTFSDDAGILSYLNNREFEIKNVTFAKKRKNFSKNS